MLAVFQGERFLGVLHIARTRDMGANKSDTYVDRVGSALKRFGMGEAVVDLRNRMRMVRLVRKRRHLVLGCPTRPLKRVSRGSHGRQPSFITEHCHHVRTQRH